MSLGWLGLGLGAVGSAASIAAWLAGLLPTDRVCVVKIINSTSRYTLDNPSVYIFSGRCAEELSFQLVPGASGAALFTKTPHAACGAVGVFTFDLVDKSTKKATEKMAVMYSVPYDYTFYSNWYAVGVFDLSVKCDYDLYYQMYYNSSSKFVRRKAGHNIEHWNRRVTIEASMADTYKPVMKLELRDD